MNNEIPFVQQIRREGDDVVQVCQKTFKSVLAIGPKRLVNLLRYLWENNNPRPERRGGFRVKQGYAELKAEIINHIKKFKYHTSHYGRNKTPNRKYLPSTLSVRNMYMVFKDEYEGPIDVKCGFYYGIFVSKFNLGFGSPKKDVCSFCTSHKVQIRATADPQKKGHRVIGSQVSRQKIVSPVGYKARWPCSDHYVWLNADCCPSKITNWWGLLGKIALGLLFRHYRTQSDGQ